MDGVGGSCNLRFPDLGGDESDVVVRQPERFGAEQPGEAKFRLREPEGMQSPTLKPVMLGSSVPVQATTSTDPARAAIMTRR